MPVDPKSVVIDLERDKLFDAFGLETLKDRYMAPGEVSPQNSLARAAAAFADDEEHAQRIYDYASKHWFMFATPVLSNGGTDRGLPISCFVSYVEDSREGILANYTENGWLASQGGGLGTYWGALRSKGEKTSRGNKTSGVIPFVKVVDSQMLAFHQGSTRRGSAAVYLDIEHPEIEEWIVMRKPSGGDANRKTLNLNNAVCISDAFMEAVETGSQWNLVDPHSKNVIKVIPARHLWRLILDTRMETGEPYLFFKDTANKALPQALKDIGLHIHSSQLCAEIMLPTGPDPRTGEMRTAVCCLSSVNLLHFDQWSHHPRFIEDLMRMLDNIITVYTDMAPPPHAAAVRSALLERSVGLGAMGWHSLLQAKSIDIESDLARAWNAMVFSHIREQADAASRVLAAERGEAPDMAGTGERFAHKMAIAPNASSGIICGNVSPSIEPRSANAFLHKTLSGSFQIKNQFLQKILAERGQDMAAVWKSIISHKGSVQHLEFLTQHEKAVFRTAIEINQMALVQLAADRQLYIDQGQSLNLFFPADASAKELHQVHFAAWKLGLKSLYYVRSEALKRADLVGLRTERQEVAVPDEECLSCQG